MELNSFVKPTPAGAATSSKLSQSQFCTPIRGHFSTPIDTPPDRRPFRRSSEVRAREPARPNRLRAVRTPRVLEPHARCPGIDALGKIPSVSFLHETHAPSTESAPRLCGAEPRLAAASPSAGAGQPQDQQENDRSNRRVDNEPRYAAGEMDAKPRKQPIAEQTADDPNRGIANQPKSRSADNSAREIADGDADQQNDDHPLI